MRKPEMPPQCHSPPGKGDQAGTLEQQRPFLKTVMREQDKGREGHSPHARTSSKKRISKDPGCWNGLRSNASYDTRNPTIKFIH